MFAHAPASACACVYACVSAHECVSVRVRVTLARCVDVCGLDADGEYVLVVAQQVGIVSLAIVVEH